jgi:hypothetical protein
MTIGIGYAYDTPSNVILELEEGVAGLSLSGVTRESGSRI